MWSGPRNISTAMMRAFENRADTVVSMSRCTPRTSRAPGSTPGVCGGDLVAADDLADAIAGLYAPMPPGCRIHYAKHMAHHVSRDMDMGWTLGFRNVLLIRDPSKWSPLTFARARRARRTTSGCPSRVAARAVGRAAPRGPDHRRPRVPGRTGATPPLALRLARIPFSARMLSWPPGPRDSDGVWAPHWYASSGPRPDSNRGARGRSPSPQSHDAAVADACRPIYAELLRAAAAGLRRKR